MLLVQTLNKQMSQKKLLFTNCFDKKIAALIDDNRLTGLYVLEQKGLSKVGAVYIGKVKNVVKNIGACFVEIEGGELCFLSLKEAENAYLLNRPGDGRILQEDELLVQVQRDAIKTKQAGLTTKINLSTDYFAFSLGSPKLGISSKLSKECREGLKRLLREHGIIDSEDILIQNSDMPAYGLVLRTASLAMLEEIGPEEYIKLLQETHRKFIDLVIRAKYQTCFSCLQSPPSVYSKALAYFGTTAYDEIVTDDTEALKELKTETTVRFYEDEMLPLPKLYSLETKVKEALSSNVWLPSGASIVIEQTESMNVIDVNSGKFDKKTASSDSIYRINKEAAKEIALQIRLRNLTGIIIVDFINMKSKEDNERILQDLRRFVSDDHVYTQVIDMTPLGLVEIARQKGYKSIKEQWNN